ncbi:uncharacterized protein DS421_6g184980 [Arachis hypogaea]|nr:uncharacterized protein DS421_6g184980 [Arachis hypogaea]
MPATAAAYQLAPSSHQFHSKPVMMESELETPKEKKDLSRFKGTHSHTHLAEQKKASNDRRHRGRAPNPEMIFAPSYASVFRTC